MSRTLIAVFSLVIAFLASGYPRTVERVSLLTCGPGKEVYELEGHTALRITFDDGSDVAVNWGVFDFNSPNFLYRFVKGETDYLMAIYPFASFYQQYDNEGRYVVERELNISKEAKQRLVELIDSTLTVGSPVYRYNYVLDNCATRPMDYVGKAIGSPIKFGPDNGIERTTASFRDDMKYYHTNYPWYQFGIDLALGSGIDRPISYDEHRFAPIALDRMLDGATYTDEEGETIILSNAPVVILSEQRSGRPHGATPFLLTPLFICWLFFAITATICCIDFKHKRITRWFHSLYYSLATIAGVLLTFLIFVSVHESTSPNWLYLWLNPVCIIGAVGVWLKNFNKAVFWWQIVNFVALLALAVIWLCGAQRLNAAFAPLIAADAFLALTRIASIKWQK